MRNPEIRLLEDKVAQQGGCFEPVDDGIYYIGRTSAGTPRAFRFYSFTSGNSVDIAPTPHDSVDDVTVTPDRKRLAYVTYSTGGQDLVQLTFK